VAKISWLQQNLDENKKCLTIEEVSEVVGRYSTQRFSIFSF